VVQEVRQTFLVQVVVADELVEMDDLFSFSTVLKLLLPLLLQVAQQVQDE
jgi:hypothetical protein